MKDKLKVCKNEDCSRKDELLPLTEFYQYPKGEYYAECKECHSHQVQSNKEIRAMKAIETLLKLGIIKHDEISAARTLFLSCESRIKACKYNEGIYKDIECDWESPLAFIIDIIQKLPKVFQCWKVQNAIYEETKQTSDLPTIDRVDEFGNYTLTNIQMLSKHDNTKKATSKPCKVLIIKNLQILDVIEFKSKREMTEKLIEMGIPINAIKIKMDTGVIQEVSNGYSILLQSKNGVIKRLDEPLYKFIIDRKREKIDVETGEVVEVLNHWQYQFNVGAIRF